MRHVAQSVCGAKAVHKDVYCIKKIKNKRRDVRETTSCSFGSVWDSELERDDYRESLFQNLSKEKK